MTGRSNSTWRIWASLAVLLVAAGCGTGSLSPLPLSITVQASKTTAIRGDTIVFTTVSQGGTLVGIDMDYGDLSADQFGTSGARTATVSFKHAFLVGGTYQVKATITDAVAGSTSATVQVLVN